MTWIRLNQGELFNLDHADLIAVSEEDGVIEVIVRSTRRNDDPLHYCVKSGFKSLEEAEEWLVNLHRRIE